MKRSFGLGLLAMLLGFLASAQPAVAQESAQTKQNWQCKINIAVPGITIPASVSKTVFYTTKTRKQCPGNTSTSGGTANLTIDCETEGPIAGWSGSAQNNSAPFVCQVYREPCGLDGLLPTRNASLQINGSGIAKLRCTCAATLDANGQVACASCLDSAGNNVLCNGS